MSTCEFDISNDIYRGNPLSILIILFPFTKEPELICFVMSLFCLAPRNCLAYSLPLFCPIREFRVKVDDVFGVDE